ncbi:hypothetical protein EGW08_014181, partial [Elysia chlorotica]
MAPPHRGLCFLDLWVLFVTVGLTSAQNYDQEPASWELSDFGLCSSPCGGGLQTRHVNCVRRISWATFSNSMKIRVANSECPKPAPPKSQSCNDHKCQAEWSPQEWSRCSTTCGLGTQTRRVHCTVSWGRRTLLPGGDQHLVSDSECGGSRPLTSRACHLMDCPVMEDPDQPLIEAENYTLWQLSKTKRLTANVGGQLNLLPGQNVVIRCPVRHSSAEELIYWTKDRKLLSLYDHLTIRRASLARDAGTYTCTAQHDSANITINFIKSRGAVDSYNSTNRNNSSNIRRRQQRDQSHQERNKHVRRGERDRTRKKQDMTPAFVTGAWSRCNATCSSRGQRSREVTCSQVTRKFAKVMPETECLKSGLVKPNATISCFHRGRCAIWMPGHWT